MMIRNLFSSQLRINMTSGVIVTVINSVVLAVAYPVYLHFLGYEQYGVWLVLSTVMSFAQLGNLGINHAVMKLVAEEYGRHDLEAVQQYVSSAVAILAVCGLIALALILLFQSQIIALFKLSQENTRVALWLLPYVGCLSVYVFIVQTVNAALAGLGRMDLANYAQTGGRVVAVLVAMILLLAGQGIVSLFVSNVLAYVLTHVASLLLIRRVAPVHLLLPRHLSLQRVKRLFRFGLSVFGGLVFTMLLDPFNRLLLSRYAGVAAIPVFEIAYQGSMQIRCLLEAGLRSMLPEVSRVGVLMTEEARARIHHINQGVMRVIVLGGAPVYGLMILFASVLLQLWLGPRFVPTLPGAMRILLVGSFLSLLGVPAYYTLMGLNRPQCALVASFILCGLNMVILLGLLLVGVRTSVPLVAWSLLISMGATTLYLLSEKHRLVDSVSGAVPAAAAALNVE